MVRWSSMIWTKWLWWMLVNISLLQMLNGILQEDMFQRLLAGGLRRWFIQDCQFISCAQGVIISHVFKVDNGYNIWSFQGKLLQRHSITQFCQMLWRPRPPTLLSDDQVTVCLTSFGDVMTVTSHDVIFIVLLAVYNVIKCDVLQM